MNSIGSMIYKNDGGNPSTILVTHSQSLMYVIKNAFLDVWQLANTVNTCTL